MAQELQNYVDGKWVDALDGERFDVFNPATGEVVATAPHSKQADVEPAIDAARRTFDEGAWWPRTSEREQARGRAVQTVLPARRFRNPRQEGR